MEEEASTTRCYNMIKILCDEKKNYVMSIKIDIQLRTKIEHPEIEMYVCVYACVSQ